MFSKWIWRVNYGLGGLAALLVLGAIFTSIFSTSAIEEPASELSKPKERRLPTGSFTQKPEVYNAIGSPVIETNTQPPTLQLPDLRAVLNYYGTNNRPDAAPGQVRLHFGIAGNTDIASVAAGQPLYLLYDRAKPPGRYIFSPENQPTGLWVEATPNETGATIKVSLKDEQGRSVKEPAQRAEFTLQEKEFARFGGGTWEIGKNRVDGTLLARQRARWYGQDEFFNAHGGTEYGNFTNRERIEFGDGDDRYVVYLGSNECLIWDGKRWSVPTSVANTKSYPILCVKKVEDRIMRLDLWDTEGKGRVALNLLKSTEAWAPQIIQKDFKFVSIRTLSQYVFDVRKDRMVLRPGDWLLQTPDGWKKLVTPDEIDSYVDGKTNGVLFVINGMVKTDGGQVISGTLYNSSRSVAEELEIPVELGSSGVLRVKQGADETQKPQDGKVPPAEAPKDVAPTVPPTTTSQPAPTPQVVPTAPEPPAPSPPPAPSAPPSLTYEEEILPEVRYVAEEQVILSAPVHFIQPKLPEATVDRAPLVVIEPDAIVEVTPQRHELAEGTIDQASPVVIEPDGTVETAPQLPELVEVPSSSQNFDVHHYLPSLDREAFQVTSAAPVEAPPQPLEVVATSSYPEDFDRHLNLPSLEIEIAENDSQPIPTTEANQFDSTFFDKPLTLQQENVHVPVIRPLGSAAREDKMKYSVRILAITLLATTALLGQTIAEKKAGLVRGGGGEFDPATQQQLRQVNRELRDRQAELRALYAEVLPLYESGAPESSYQQLVDKIKIARVDIDATNMGWRDTVTDIEKGEEYALWSQTGTTIEQLVIDYGSQSFVYVIPPEIGKIPLSVVSAVPIPRALWGEMLELILSQQGIGVQQLNPYLRMLYLNKDNQSGIKLITNDRKELEILPRDARIAFILSPDPTESRRVGSFLQRFINPRTTSFSMVGRDLLLVTTVAEVQELLKLYDFVAKNRGELEYKLVPLIKVDTKEMADILQGIFEQIAKQEFVQAAATPPGSPTPPPAPPSITEINGLKIIPLTQVARAVFLLGTKDEIAKAEEIIREVEEQVGTARGKVVYTYRSKHSDPEQLADLLSKIYMVFTSERLENLEDALRANAAWGQPFFPGYGSRPLFPGQRPAFDPQSLRPGEQPVFAGQPPGFPGQSGGYFPGMQAPGSPPLDVVPVVESATHPQRATIYSNPFPTTVDDSTAFYQSGAVVIAPAPILMGQPVERPVNQGRNNFIVDPKTGYIVMVVQPDILPRLKDVIKRIDVAPKMVQLDVLLFEKDNSHTNNFGLNLLRVADAANNAFSNSLVFNDTRIFDPCAGLCSAITPTGILDFFIGRPKDGDVPAYDIAYRFLMSQNDVTINANPTLTTLNQTPARIAVVTESSIATGVVQVQASGGIQAKDAFTRAQYGTNITITPTIHARDPNENELWDEGPDYITLETEVNFDTTIPNVNNRPDVVRRNIKNIVRVPDGESVILGGLRSKQAIDGKSGVPFLGEIPGVGKLFSFTSLSDTSTEMFIFITPTIVYDPCEDFERIRLRELARRPGDIPDFLCCLDRARRAEQDALFSHGMTEILSGPRLERCIPWGDSSCEGGGRGNGRRNHGRH